MKVAAAAAMMLASACAAAPAPAPVEDIPAHGGEGACDAAKVQSLVGRPGNAELGAEALRLSGAAALRWQRPGEMYTMDFRPDRLNIVLDEQGRVTALRCG